MTTEKLKELRDFTQERKFKMYRSFLPGDYRQWFKKLKLNFAERNAEIFRIMCDSEDPVVFPDERISFARTKQNIPRYYDGKFIKKMYRPKKGVSWEVVHNICPDYAILLNCGVEGRLNIVNEQLGRIVRHNSLFAFLKRAVSYISRHFLRGHGIGFAGRVFNGLERMLLPRKQREEISFLQSAKVSLESLLNLARRYALAAKAAGNKTVEAVLNNVPRLPAKTFHEALQSVRMLNAAFYLDDTFQLGFGRMDQYLRPYYEQDIREQRLTREEAKNLLAEFFISLNRDTDLYNGVQQGDNGQSLMLGGCLPDGSSAVNDLTCLIMETARDLRLIDPKINLRIDSNTPEYLLELGCELTRCGLGFPQYSNDEVVIPALVKKGYSLEDARNYTVAACWEFIIPGKGMDVVNQGAVSFPAAVDRAFSKTLAKNFTLKKLRKNIKDDIRTQIKAILKKRKICLMPSPLVSAFMHGALESRRDASVCAQYHNIGIHGAGSANAADALAAILCIFESKGIAGLMELEKAKAANFSGYEPLRKTLLDDMPKVGNADDAVDRELRFLFDSFADAAESFSTCKKQVRPGSGSAQFYIWLTRPDTDWLIEPKVKATADGRLEGEPLSSSLAPAQNVKVNGVISVLKSFSKIDYSRIMNGGPITIELTPSVFNSGGGIKKLAALIRYFVELGNQQLQINVLNAKTLEDAIKYPDKHRNLIVRVWGWSGYFCELAPEYQQHVLHRHQYDLG